FPRETAFHRCCRPLLPSDALRLLLVRYPAHREPAVPRLTRAARLVERLDQRSVGTGPDQAVGHSSRQVRRARSTGGAQERRQFVGETVQAGVLDGEVAAMVALVAAGPQESNDVDGLGESLLADLGLGPALPENVLVQVLTRA